MHCIANAGVGGDKMWETCINPLIGHCTSRLAAPRNQASSSRQVGVQKNTSKQGHSVQPSYGSQQDSFGSAIIWHESFSKVLFSLLSNTFQPLSTCKWALMRGTNSWVSQAGRKTLGEIKQRKTAQSYSKVLFPPFSNTFQLLSICQVGPL